MSNIDYIVISSNDDPLYKDFYPIISKRWKDLGYKTLYINITDKDDIEETEYGIIYSIKSLNFVPTGFQAQVARLFAPNLIEGVLLMSDIDMLPINGNYYKQYIPELTESNIIIYSGQPYGNVPYYPMCYVLAHSNTLKNCLDISNMSYSEFCKMLIIKYGEKWNVDENFLYDKIMNKDNVVIKTRDFSRRIDRSNWAYDKTLLKDGHYIDSHLLRPYSSYKNRIDDLLQDI
jgi:hypothetical protein